MKPGTVGLVLASFVIGCGAAQLASSQRVARLVVPDARAGTNPTRWEYTCSENLTANDLNALGAKGWELAAAAGPAYDHTQPIWCFKRALP